jgi:hypothetical protein
VPPLPAAAQEKRAHRVRGAAEPRRPAVEPATHAAAREQEMLAPAPEAEREVVLHRADTLRRDEF